MGCDQANSLSPPVVFSADANARLRRLAWPGASKLAGSLELEAMNRDGAMNPEFTGKAFSLVFFFWLEEHQQEPQH